MFQLDIFQLFIISVLLFCLVPTLGIFIANVMEGKKHCLMYPLGWLENFSYRISGVDAQEEMNWKVYAKALCLFNFFGFVFLFIVQIFQEHLPFNPQQFLNVPWALAFNTAASFVTNTNWQAYAGETTLSYGTQMYGLTTQNFLSAATGNCVLLVLIRGIRSQESQTIGNFWSDLVRTIVYLLLPLSFVAICILLSQGVIQTLSPYVELKTLQGDSQTIPLGPVASQIAIKQLGSNGGGFFNANSAHPFENPTVLTNILENFLILWIPASLIYAYGILINAKKHAILLLFLMSFLILIGFSLSVYAERLHNPILDVYPNMEGKETRFGPVKSVLWSVFTTATSNGSVNNMLSSLSPLAGGVALFNMMLGEIIFGGVGVGLCSLIMFILLTVFLSGLMIGRTPEYMNKKIEKNEIQWVIAAILIPSILILLGSGLAVSFPQGIESLSHQGPHGLSEILYAYTSAAANNGSAFGGLNANTNFYNISLGMIMIITRLAIIIPSLAIGGNLASKKQIALSLGSLRTDNLLFILLLLFIILIVGALTFFPALTLGPVIEHLLMLEGKGF